MNAQPVNAQRAAANSARTLDARPVEDALRADTAGLQGSYGVSVVDLTTGLTYGIGTNIARRAASVNKMPILVALYERATQGRLDLDQSLTLTDDDIQHYGTGVIQDPSAPRTYTLRELAALMVETSDNTAAYVLERLLGQATIQSDLARWNLTHTSMADNTTTPADAASLFAALYRGQLLPAAARGVILTLLEHTVFDTRLATGLPAGLTVAHKVGTDVGVYNDAGLVLAPSHPYAIAVLSQDANETEADRAFARISADVYQFEMSLPPAPAP